MQDRDKYVPKRRETTLANAEKIFPRSARIVIHSSEKKLFPALLHRDRERRTFQFPANMGYSPFADCNIRLEIYGL